MYSTVKRIFTHPLLRQMQCSVGETWPMMYGQCFEDWVRRLKISFVWMVGRLRVREKNLSLFHLQTTAASDLGSIKSDKRDILDVFIDCILD